MAKPVQVSPDKHFVEHDGTMIEIPRPLEEMTQADWVKLALGPKSPLNSVVIDNQSFLGLHVVLKDKNYIPIWLYAGGQRDDIPRAFDTLERAIAMGATLVSSEDEIQTPVGRFQFSADGHIHRDDVVLAKVPVVSYYALQAQNIRKSKSAIEFQSAESKAYEGVDMPKHIKGNRTAPIYEATEHTVQYQDRPRF